MLCTGNFLSLFLQLYRGFINPPALPSANSTLWPLFLPRDIDATNAYFLDQSSPEHAAEVAFTIFTVSFVPLAEGSH